MRVDLLVKALGQVSEFQEVPFGDLNALPGPEGSVFVYQVAGSFFPVAILRQEGEDEDAHVVLHMWDGGGDWMQVVRP